MEKNCHSPIRQLIHTGVSCYDISLLMRGVSSTSSQFSSKNKNFGNESDPYADDSFSGFRDTIYVSEEQRLNVR